MLAPGAILGRDVMWVASGGEPTLANASRTIEPDDCRTWIEDRRGSHRCRRRGWFALRDHGGTLVGPLCATHLQLLSRHGGAVVG